MKTRKIRVGIDFDGVIAYNPFRVVRAPVTYAKRLLGQRKTEFYIPRTKIEEVIWGVLHESSVFPARGVRLLRSMIQDGAIEAYLVTGRFRYLQGSLYRWLRRHDMETLFSGIHMNLENNQPHLHKHAKIRELKLDYFIEDNWDIVEYVTRQLPSTQVLWIYNLLDRSLPYPRKFPYLEQALRHIETYPAPVRRGPRQVRKGLAS